MQTILDAEPDVLNHNIETVSRLYPTVRSGANYKRSLELLAEVKKRTPHIPTKTGMMVGLGETVEELHKTWTDLRQVSCDILTVGQYLQPTANHLSVERFISPEEFAELEKQALRSGFSGVAAGAFVRSSYEAEKLYRKAR